MQTLTAITVFNAQGRAGRYVFTKHMLAKLFAQDSAKTFSEGLRRLVQKKILVRACRGIYVYSDAISFDRFVLE
ncbi:MAG: hypothetical protein NTU49_09535, partial [Gammaproteobacteria bacterium]|nr:hypothetical protein [Gammaproteobacteria bacterium]